jgi:hypothetical protein
MLSGFFSLGATPRRKVTGPSALIAELADDPRNPDAGARGLNLYCASTRFAATDDVVEGWGGAAIALFKSQALKRGPSPAPIA